MNFPEPEIMINNDIHQPKKRGRRPKVHDTSIKEEPKEPVEIKKRGRKPTCKILNKSDLVNIKREIIDECLIVQLPLTKTDIEKMMNPLKTQNISPNISPLKREPIIDLNSGNNYTNVEEQETKNNYDRNNLHNITLKTEYCHNVHNQENNKKSLEFQDKQISYSEQCEMKYNIVDKCNNCDELKQKINEIESKYHVYKITNMDKQIYNLSIKLENIYNEQNIWNSDINTTCCWWCCHTFDTLPIGLPEKYYDNIFKVIGFFCSFECAFAYNLSINDHKIWDRISLLYHLRNLIFIKMHSEQNISILDNIIAAGPRNLLKMFGGSQTIEEFRSKSTLLKKQYRNIMPPIMSLVNQLEESTYNDDQNLVIKPHKPKIFDSKNNELVLRRSKPIANKSSLMSSMGIKYKD